MVRDPSHRLRDGIVRRADCLATLLEQSRATAAFDGTTWTNRETEGGSAEGWHVAWLNFTDLAQSVRDDVARIRNHLLTPDDVPVHGLIYDVRTGTLVPVDASTIA